MKRMDIVHKLVAVARLASNSGLDDAARLIRHTACAIAMEEERHDLEVGAEAERRAREEIDARTAEP